MDTNYTITANFVFATPADPVITTVAATNITNSTAVLNGNIEDIGVPAATAKGFEYSTVNEFVEGTGTVAITAGRMEVGQYRTTITQLAPNTQYYFRAFVDYEGTRKYGAEIGFSTNDIDPVVPVVITNATTDITETTATLNGNLSNIGYPAADAIGFSYSTSDDFANSIEVAVDMKEGDFFANISNLTANTTYYTKA